MSLVSNQWIKPKLEHIDIEITRKCNYSCIHCSAGKINEEQYNELRVDEIKELIDSSFKIGLNKIGFTGGEPLCESKKLFELIQYSKNDYDLPIHIHSNGSLINETTSIKLKKYDVLTTISIFSTDEDINDLITNKKGSFNQSLDGIKNCLKNDVDLHIFIVPLKHNYLSIKKSIRELYELGVNNFRILSLSPTGRAFDVFNKITLEESDSKRLSMDMNELIDTYHINIQSGFCTHQNLPELSFLKGHDKCYSGKTECMLIVTEMFSPVLQLQEDLFFQ